MSTGELWWMRAEFVRYAYVMIFGFLVAYFLIAYSAAILLLRVWLETNFEQARGSERHPRDPNTRAPWAVLIAFFCVQSRIHSGKPKHPDPDWPTILAFFGIFFLVGIVGNFRAAFQMRFGGFGTTITLTSESGTKPEVRYARVVRVIDTGLLLVFKDAPGQLAYVRYESVRTLAEPVIINP